jgi:CBS domain-containing protein
MPYQVQQIIEDKTPPVCVLKTDLVPTALSLMIEHGYSQLPVEEVKQDTRYPIGKMITYEGILRGMRNFKVPIESLRVMDVMTDVPSFSTEDDIFEILDRLKETAAVLITDMMGQLVGIVTTFDTTEYFRSHTGDLMRVEDIETIIRDFIKEAYMTLEGELDQVKLDQECNRVANTKNQGDNAKTLKFTDLSLNDYINLLCMSNTWSFFQPIFGLPCTSVRTLLNEVRVMRNTLAHFKGDLTPEQRDKLQYCADWLNTCQTEYQERKEEERIAQLFKLAIHANKEKEPVEILHPEPVLLSAGNTAIAAPTSLSQEAGNPKFTVIEADSDTNRYAPLADWLQSQPGSKDSIVLTFKEIEDKMSKDLPISARNHRAWWANDSESHPQSSLWLDAGWRTTYINLGEGRVGFSRIKERERAYIAFYSSLLSDLRSRSIIPIRDASPDGASWIIVKSISMRDQAYAYFNFSFSRDKRLRVELYLDTRDTETTKKIFDNLLSHKAEVETQVGSLSWERLDNRRASRVAAYKNGQIDDDPAILSDLRHWAADTMIKFYQTLEPPTREAIAQVLSQQ